MKILFVFFSCCILNIESDLRLNIIHVNDIHAHFEEVNAQLGRCHEDQKAEYFLDSSEFIATILFQTARNHFH